MDVVDKVQRYLSKWDNGGSEQCVNVLTGPHSDPADLDSIDTLTTVYHALLVSVLTSWPVQPALTVDVFVQFVHSMFERLPSSSSTAANPPDVVPFSEVLVDVVWSVDTELDDFISDAKSALAEEQKGADGSKTFDRDVVARGLRTKQSAEGDKETLAVIVRRLLSLGVLDADVCRERLDLSLVANVGLVPDKLVFEKKEIRTRTGLFYKQNKFNLLREQSEGYSKLVTELTSYLGPPHSPSTGHPTEPRAAIEARARPAWERIVGLIGYFDLDPNRALDVILDVFSTHLATHHAFFIAFLSCSPWSLHPQHLRKRREDEMVVEPDPQRYRGKSLDEVLAMAESADGKVSPPPMANRGTNSRVLAQVLGFKFAHYQLPDVNEAVPRNLYLMTAILIREDFLSLEDLMLHITPADDDMEAVHKQYLAKVEERISNAKISQLAMAAPLESAGTASRAKDTPTPEPKKEAKEPPNQKLGLLNALFAVGALRPAISLLSKWPWMVDAFPEISDLIIRTLQHSITPLYEANGNPKKATSFTKPRARYGSTGVMPPTERRPHLTLWAPTPPSTSYIDFVFFFPDWTQRIPVCSTLDDLVDVIEPLMKFIGLHISRDPSFLTKFLRLGRTHMMTTLTIDPETKKPVGTPDPEDPVRQFWFKVLRLYLLPTLPLIRGNAVCTVDVWNIIRQFETTMRWQLYGEWKTSTYKSHPELRVRQVQSDRESKGILRRLSHNTIDSLSGTVAKLAHSNPCIFFTNAVNQIMAYDNLAGVVIQALNYVTIMGFDVLVYVILDAMANPDKERLKDDGVNTSDWLQSIASFTGMLFRRYSADLTPLLKYIVHQLHNGQTTEIIVLRELIWKMAGIEPLPSLSDAQVAAMAGGPSLRIEAVASATRGARLEPGDAVLKGPQRLGKALLESNLALPLLIQVAQQRQSCVFQAPNAYLKSLASLYDTTHGVLLQYLDLLTTPTVVSPEDYAQKIVPPLAELHEKYGISIPLCMQIIRPMLNVSIRNAALAMQEKERLASEEAEKRLKAALTAKREPNNASGVASPSTAETPTAGEAPQETKNNGTEPSNGDMNVDVTAENGPATVAQPESPWLPELYALFDDAQKIAPPLAAQWIRPGFYLTFWQLSTYELAPPAARYDEECSTLRNLSRQEDSKYISAERSSDRTKRQKSYLHRDRRNRYNQYIHMLGEELKEQTAVRVFTIKRLAREKQHWFTHFPGVGVSAMPIAQTLVDYCFLPRCLLSPMDADFCAQFIKVVHHLSTPGFPTISCWDRILGDGMKSMIFSCSEYEARNYARFLHSILTDGLKWWQDEALFTQETHTKANGRLTVLPGSTRRKFTAASLAEHEVVPWSDWKRLMRKWHWKLALALVQCIDSGEFMNVYNAIIVLKEVLPVFPIGIVNKDSGTAINNQMEKFIEKETRGDLKILGRAYMASFKKRESVWKRPDGPPPPKERPAAAPTENHARVAAPIPTAPSAPRAQLAATNGTANAQPERVPSATKAALASVPRPEVVKRVRPDLKPGEDRGTASPKPAERPEAMDVDVPATRPNGVQVTPTKPSESAHPSEHVSTPSAAPANRDVARLAQEPRPSTPNGRTGGTPQPPRPPIPPEQRRTESGHAMPPPTTPSQTISAQELRDTARSTRGPNERADERPLPSVEARPIASLPVTPSTGSRRRSPSPPSKPGTRNPSVESRASGGRRSDRDERRPERETRGDGRDYGRREGQSHTRERSSRSARDSERDKDGDRDRERGRDRHGERERVRDRDREREREPHKEKESRRERERERERERDRDRDRDRHRDRHRTDEKDRDSRKDRDAAREPSTIAAPPPSDDRGLPPRPEAPRHRDGDEHPLGKRRRPTDDEPERPSKRPSRKDSHHEDRSRRSSDKEGRDRGRESDRRRKERDQAEGDGKNLSLGDKRIPEGPASSTARSLPPTTPSAPRAMASGDASRLRTDSASGREREWKRDQGLHPSSSGASIGGSGPTDIPPGTGGSLRSRISDKEAPRSLPQAPSSYRPELGNDRNGESSGRDDDRDGSRKRTLSEREKDAGDATGTAAEQTQPSKRPRIRRDRYTGTTSHGLAKKLLPIDPQADKTRMSRNS
ncbi:transcription factor/nuclear export subunit protein 2-domain-containing protein [Fomitopsis betulina]|nr:transcription factor/nuclear export subunit protein 2-domain-containing protein [Fomitopsis betulina]